MNPHLSFRKSKQTFIPAICLARRHLGIETIQNTCTCCTTLSRGSMPRPLRHDDSWLKQKWYWLPHHLRRTYNFKDSRPIFRNPPRQTVASLLMRWPICTAVWTVIKRWIEQISGKSAFMLEKARAPVFLFCGKLLQRDSEPSCLIRRNFRNRQSVSGFRNLHLHQPTVPTDALCTTLRIALPLKYAVIEVSST